MGVFVRAVITGFGFSLGKALFDRFSARVGLSQNKEQAPPIASEEPPDPDHNHEHAGAPLTRPWR